MSLSASFSATSIPACVSATILASRDFATSSRASLEIHHARALELVELLAELRGLGLVCAAVDSRRCLTSSNISPTRFTNASRSSSTPDRALRSISSHVASVPWSPFGGGSVPLGGRSRIIRLPTSTISPVGTGARWTLFGPT